MMLAITSSGRDGRDGRDGFTRSSVASASDGFTTDTCESFFETSWRPGSFDCGA